MIGTNLSVLSSALDSFIAVFVKVGKVLPNFFVCSWDDVSILDGSELAGQGADCGDMEFVLM